MRTLFGIGSQLPRRRRRQPKTSTTSTTTTTATQTSAPETFEQWREIQGKYLLELHKLRHGIQRTLDQILDPRQPLPAGCRNNSPESTFDAHSAAQTPLLTLPLLITASCCTWDKCMVGNDCSPKASGSCVILTVGPAWSVAPYGRGDATPATVRTSSGALGTPFRTVGSLVSTT